MFFFVIVVKELILDTLHFTMKVDVRDALENEAMAVFTSLLVHDVVKIRSQAARNIMDLRCVCLCVCVSNNDLTYWLGMVFCLLFVLFYERALFKKMFKMVSAH